MYMRAYWVCKKQNVLWWAGRCPNIQFLKLMRSGSQVLNSFKIFWWNIQMGVVAFFWSRTR